MSVKEKKITEQTTLLKGLEGDLRKAEARVTKAKAVVVRARRDVRGLKASIAEAKEWLSALTEDKTDTPL